MAAGLWTTVWEYEDPKLLRTEWLLTGGHLQGVDELHFYKTRCVPETHVQIRAPGAQRPFGTYFLGQSQLYMVCYVVKIMYPDSWSANLTPRIRILLFTNRLLRGKKKGIFLGQEKLKSSFIVLSQIYLSHWAWVWSNPFQEGAQQLLTDAYRAGNSEQSRKEKSDSALVVHIRRRNLSCGEREIKNLYHQVQGQERENYSKV